MGIRFFYVTVLASSIAISSSASNDIPPAVKLSRSGICHDTESTYYSKVTSFTPFDSMSECLANGRRPKPYNKSLVSYAQHSELRKKSIPLYNRDDYPHWLDQDGNGLNTRHDILSDLSIIPAVRSGNRIIFGKWYCPYSNQYFSRSSSVQIDHIVPLYWAHRRSAYKWSRNKKAEFANDRENLLVVKSIENKVKSSSGIADWLPKNEKFKCQYILKFERVRIKYGLEYLNSEKAKSESLVYKCKIRG